MDIIDEITNPSRLSSAGGNPESGPNPSRRSRVQAGIQKPGKEIQERFRELLAKQRQSKDRVEKQFFKFTMQNKLMNKPTRLFLMGCVCFLLAPFQAGNCYWYSVYNPADSTLYHSIFAYNEDDEIVSTYVFRFKDNGRILERSPMFDTYDIQPGGSLTTDFLLTDNISNHLYAFCFKENFHGQEWLTLESFNGGDDWLISDTLAILVARRGTTGERPGESFVYGRYIIGDEYAKTFYRTENSWDTWDTLNADQGGIDLGDQGCIFGQQNGHLRRRSGDEELDFSDDYGLNWQSTNIDDPVDGDLSLYAGPDTDVYLGIWDIFCFQDSGRTTRHIINPRDYFDFRTIGAWGWNYPTIIPTDTPGELYVLADSLMQGLRDTKFLLFHITDYGENISIYFYDLPGYEPCEPIVVSVNQPPKAVPVPMNLVAFPNPSNSGFNFRISSMTQPGELTVYDLNGREIRNFNLIQNPYPKILHFDGRSSNGGVLVSGSYLVMLKSGDKSLTRWISLTK